jgi:hypothetical protein
MKVFQIQLSDADVAAVNKNEKVTAYAAYSSAMCNEFPGKQYYSHVADIDTADLDYAFEVGNIGPEEKITRYARMHSVSVGDVLEVNGVGFMVKSCGFEAVW